MISESKDEDKSHSNCICIQMKNAIRRFIHRSSILYHQLSTSEISGSLGDLGTLIPLLVTMARERTVLLSPALFFAGLSNVLTGYAWDVPMCVQPMKSIAAVAISDSLSALEVTTAGIWMGLFMTFIGGTGLIEIVNRIVTPNVVSGIQLGVGLKLAGKGLKMVQDLGWFGENSVSAEVAGKGSPDSIWLALICSVLVLYWLHVNNINSSSSTNSGTSANTNLPTNNTNIDSPTTTTTTTTTTTSAARNFFKYLCCCFKAPSKQFQHPVGLYLFFIGILFGTITLSTSQNANQQYDLPLRWFGAPVAVWALKDVTWEDWRAGLLEGAIPQIPLTTLNSVISVCALAHALYPPPAPQSQQNNEPHKHIPSREEVSISVGLMNLLFCPFGSMPNCHGAGGLAAQHRLGARHGASVVFLGVGKILLSVFLGASSLTLLDALPEAILGIMLLIAGVELCVTGLVFLVDSSYKYMEEKHRQDQEEKEEQQHLLQDNGNAIGHLNESRDSCTEEECLTRNSSDVDDDFEDDEAINPFHTQSNINSDNNHQTSQTSNSATTNTANSRNKKLAADKKEYLRRNMVVTIITASVIVYLGKTHYGALSGWATHLIYNRGWYDLWTDMKTYGDQCYMNRRRGSNNRNHSDNDEEDVEEGNVLQLQQRVPTKT